MKIGGYPIVFLQLLIFCGMFVVGEKRREKFALRITLSLLVCFVLSFALEYLDFGVGLNDFKFIITFFILFGLILGTTQVCFDIKFISAVFNCSGGYALQHIVFCVVVIFQYFFPLPDGLLKEQIFLRYLCIHLPLTVPFALAVYYLLIRRMKRDGIFEEVDLSSVVLSFMTLFCSVVLNELSRIKVGGEVNLFTSRVVCKLYSLLCCLFILFLQVVELRWKRTVKDKMFLEFMHKQKKSQYEFSKETIDLVNMKYHDLKHQLNALRVVNPKDNAKMIDDIEKGIKVYDSFVRTGNEALDIILTENALRCNEKQINLGFTVDGAALKAIDALDIYSLFGNALDNAIKSVSEEPVEKRTVTLKVYAQSEMLFINVENYCSKRIEFTGGGLPKSSGDSRYHGYGMRSIDAIVKKYGGHLHITSGDDKFFLGIVIPLNRV